MHEPETTEEDSREFAITDYLQPNLDLSDVPSIRLAQSCSHVFALFKELVRKELSEFWIKLALLLDLASDARKTQWDYHELIAQFYWLQEGHCQRIIHQLRQSGWLEYESPHYSLTLLGRNILSVLSALASQEDAPDALGATISSLSLLEMYQHDPTNTLRMFLNELMRIDEEIQQTLESNSEYLIRKLNQQIRSQFDIAIRSREYLENMTVEDFAAYTLKQQIHGQLSAFHARLSQVQRRQNDMVARKIVLADTSLTYHDINTFLIQSSLGDLAKLGRAFISPSVSVFDFVPQLMVYEAEWQLEKMDSEVVRRGWSDVESAQEGADSPQKRSRIIRFLTELNHQLDKQPSIPLEVFVPHQNWTESAFRFSMISVLEGGELPEGMMEVERLPRIQVTSVEEGAALKTAVLQDPVSGVQEMTSGIISKIEEPHGK